MCCIHLFLAGQAKYFVGQLLLGLFIMPLVNVKVK